MITIIKLFFQEMDHTIEQYSTPPPNYTQTQHATNGFSHTPSAAQLTSYLIIAYTIGTYYSCVLPLHFNLTLLILFSCALLVVVVASAKASLANPTDRVVYYYKWSRHDRSVVFSPQYDKILYCEFCDSYCCVNSKHCRTCNRCVNEFDHHCMWFNNCVGQRNYRHFFVSILATFAYAVLFIAHVAISSTNVDYQNGTQLVRIILAWIGAFMMGIFGFLVFNLIALHFYLMSTGQTTYQFLLKRKKEEEEEKKRLNQANKPIEGQRVTNKVMPQNPIKNQAISEQSIANTKNGRLEEEQEAKTEQMNKMNQSHKRRIESRISKQLIFDQAQSVQSKQHQNEEPQIKIPQTDNNNGSSLPRFFRKNKSLKFMLSEMEASSPLKPHNNFSDLQHNQ